MFRRIVAHLCLVLYMSRGCLHDRCVRCAVRWQVVGALDKGPAESNIEVERAARVAADRVRKMDAGLAGRPISLVKRHVYPTILLALRCLHRCPCNRY